MDSGKSVISANKFQNAQRYRRSVLLMLLGVENYIQLVIPLHVSNS